MLEAGEYALEAGCYASGIYADMLAAAPDAQGEPVGWQFYQHGEWRNGDNTIKDHKKATEEAGFRVRDVYAAPQPAPDVSALVDALEQIAELPMNPCSTENDYRLSATKAMAAAALANYHKGDQPCTPTP